jgi:predicted nucleic acid-binding protein
MSSVFADTSFYVALLLETDALHNRAMEVSATHDDRIVTSEWVLTELGNYFCPAISRGAFVRLTRLLRASPDVMICPASSEDFNAGFALYEARPDKSWSLVDCISFHLMRANGINDAWTADHHFKQAGFNALLT